MSTPLSRRRLAAYRLSKATRWRSTPVSSAIADLRPSTTRVAWSRGMVLGMGRPFSERPARNLTELPLA